MGDSEDEYDRKRRDKFRGERTESYPRGDGRRTAGDERRREDWIERDFQRSRGTHPRGEYREYRGGGGRERYSPSRAQDMVPPVKRVRTDWGDDRRGMGGYGHEGSSYENYNSGWQHFPTHSPAYPNANASRNNASEGVETQPAMLSFKNYLQTQDDNITDEDALKKYNEYKLEFKRQQLNEFFVTHKEEEWFKIKYHPEEAVKRKDDQMASLKNRVKVFQDLWDSGRFDKITVDSDKSEELVKLLDIVVIRLEGGTDLDIQALEHRNQVNFKEGSYSSKQSTSEKSTEESAEKKPSKEAEEEEEETKPLVVGGDEEEAKDEVEKEKPSSPEPEKVPSEPVAIQIDVEQEQSQKKAKELSKQKSAEGEGEGGEDSDSDSDSEPPTPTGDVNGVTDEPPPPGLDEEKEPEEDEDEDDDLDKTEGDIEEGQDEGEEVDKDTSKSDNGAEDISDKEDDQKEDKEEREEGEEGMDIDELNKEKSGRSTPEANKPRCLHRTSSIFLRNLAPTITKQEVEAMCKRYPGFLRVAIADPQPERRWFRRGWVTFQRHVNIKDICWNLNNIRLRDCELGAIVNRDLTRRIRTVNGITSHREVIRNDIKLAARMVHNLDMRAGLWATPAEIEDEKKKQEKQEDWPSTYGLDSKNPVLKNITDYLIEEASAEEEELLGITADSEEGQLADEGSSIVRDENLIRVLDRLLLYLRVVHSVDYYNHCEYPNEDEMPNRTGIMHARGIPPSTKQLSSQEVSDYCSMFEQKIASFLQPIPKISEEEYSKLGHKDPDAEVEKFVKANTQELAKDKWLCPLSGKKFKGPEFVRKHIFNKHAEKVDEVKKEVEYFNNYLRDPKRPQLPEHPGNRSGVRKEGPTDRETFSSPLQPYMQPQRYPGSYGGGYGHRHGAFVGGHGYPGPYNQGYNQGYTARPNRGGYRGRGGSAEFRPVIHYRDLDAPREPEEFI